TSRSRRKRGYDSYHALRWKLSRARQDLESQRQQGIAGEDGDRFIKLRVARRSPTANIVIVHGRELVMVRRLAVTHRDRCGDAQYRFSVLFVGRECRNAKRRPDPFAAVHCAVAHGVMDTFGTLILGWK